VCERALCSHTLQRVHSDVNWIINIGWTVLIGATYLYTYTCEYLINQSTNGTNYRLDISNTMIINLYIWTVTVSLGKRACVFDIFFNFVYLLN